MNKIIIGVIVVLIFGGLAFLLSGGKPTNNDLENNNIIKFGDGKKVTMYKSPNCGCCVGYAEELEKVGFEVETVSTNNMSDIKNKYGISASQQSCHTTVVGDYFIEGHVPLEAVEKLVKEKPEIDGIGLPRMPSGTPGMPGPKRAPYEVYQSVNGEFSDYIII